jgi:glycosyltransferase involved in cell wall biosynthesis
LVYGEWKHQSKNIKSFFTATYLESDKKNIVARDFKSEITFLFVGSLSVGKQPLYAIQLIQLLRKTNEQCKLHIYGDGILKQELIDYIKQNSLDDDVVLFGNQNQEIIKKAYQNSHFLMLPSLSEGWPKVIAESMFWGCLPIATPVSCVANMLDDGKRGLLLTMNPKIDSNEISTIIHNEKLYQDMSNKALQWSRYFTLDVFENEIALLLK